jgi:hypothetical protein
MKINPLPILNLKTFPILLLSLLGFSFGIGVILYRAGSTPESQAFTQTDEFLIWLFLIGLGGVLFFTAPFILWMDIRPLWKFERGQEFDLLFSVLLAAILFAFPAVYSRQAVTGPIEFPLMYHSQKMNIFYLAGFITVLLPGALAIWLLRRGLAVEFQQVLPEGRSIRISMQYREQLQRFLFILGLGVTLFTLATGALRQALIAANATTADAFPVNYVLIFGGYYTLLLAILYLPAYGALLEAGRLVRDTYCPLPEVENPEWDRILAKRKTLEETLQLQMSFQQSLSSGVTILAPLLSGIFSVLRE